MKHDAQFILNLIAQAIFDKKGTNILALDLRGISTITDYMIIAEGAVDRHLVAISYAIEKNLEEVGEKPVRIEGLAEGDWIVLDYLDVMVHLFAPGLREKYQLEQLWKEGKLVDLNISLDPIQR